MICRLPSHGSSTAQPRWRQLHGQPTAPAFMSSPLAGLAASTAPARTARPPTCPSMCPPISRSWHRRLSSWSVRVRRRSSICPPHWNGSRRRRHRGGISDGPFSRLLHRDSGFPVDVRADTAEEVADLFRAQRRLDLPCGLLVTVPVPAEYELPRDQMESAIGRVLA